VNAKINLWNTKVLYIFDPTNKHHKKMETATTSTTFTSKKGFTYEVFPLRKTDSGFETGMEVCDPSGNHVDEIGILTDRNKRLEDYDGVFELHMNHIRALRAAGITVPRSFEPTKKII